MMETSPEKAPVALDALWFAHEEGRPVATVLLAAFPVRRLADTETVKSYSVKRDSAAPAHPPQPAGALPGRGAGEVLGSQADASPARIGMTLAASAIRPESRSAQSSRASRFSFA